MELACCLIHITTLSVIQLYWWYNHIACKSSMDYLHFELKSFQTISFYPKSYYETVTKNIFSKNLRIVKLILIGMVARSSSIHNFLLQPEISKCLIFFKSPVFRINGVSPDKHDAKNSSIMKTEMDVLKKG